MRLLFQLKLYTTSYCHLCAEAYTLLSNLALTNQLTTIDIANDEALFSKYGIRIPVLQRSDTLAELNWPFAEDDIMAFIK